MLCLWQRFGRRLVGVLGAGLLAVVGTMPALAGPGTTCLTEIAGQESLRSIPSGLLAAVARAESGGSRYAEKGEPWPWTLNVGGRGMFFATKAEALAAIAAAQRDSPGVNIDVGCMQVSLRHHGTAFPSLEVALDPAANVRYAAGFLASLQEKTGSWAGAAGRYHSGTPDLADAYRDRVYAFWKGTRPVTAPPGFVSVAGTSTQYNRGLMPNARVIRVQPGRTSSSLSIGKDGTARVIRVGRD